MEAFIYTILKFRLSDRKNLFTFIVNGVEHKLKDIKEFSSEKVGIYLMTRCYLKNGTCFDYKSRWQNVQYAFMAIEQHDRYVKQSQDLERIALQQQQLFEFIMTKYANINQGQGQGQPEQREQKATEQSFPQ